MNNVSNSNDLNEILAQALDELKREQGNRFDIDKVQTLKFQGGKTRRLRLYPKLNAIRKCGRIEGVGYIGYDNRMCMIMYEYKIL